MKTDQSQLRTMVELIFHEAELAPNLSSPVYDIMLCDTRYIQQWVTNSHNHMQAHKNAKDHQAKNAKDHQAQLRTWDICQFPHLGSTHATNKI